MLDKIIKRIEESKTFSENFNNGFGHMVSIRTYNFDDSLQIDSYNGLYRVIFQGEKIGHFHKGDGKEEIYNAIDKIKKTNLNNAIDNL